MSKKYTCDDCGESFDHIFEYMEIHDIQISTFISLGRDVDIDLMELLEDLFYLNEEGDQQEIAEIISGVASAIYASSQGFLDNIMKDIQEAEEKQIDEIVKKEIKDLDKQIQKLLRSRENGGY